jgi:hypothetical protein
VVTLAKVVYFFKLQGFFSVIFAALKEWLNDGVVD